MIGADITAADLAGLSRAELRALIDNIDTFSVEEQRQILAITEELERRAHAQKCRMNLIEFCKFVDPTYLVATHHRKLAELLEDLAYGKKDRIAVSIPPRHGKSHLISTLFPAWFLGKFPDKKVLMVSHTGDLAVDFGRKVRNIIASDTYKSIFPNITLAADSKSAGRWATNHQGEYFACLRHHVKVHTTRGKIPANDVRVGDTLINSGKPVSVLRVYHTQHSRTYRVAGLDCSADHPIWTMNRGWVPASEIFPHDLLRVESIWDRLKALLWRAYGYLEHSRVSSLVQHQGPLREPAQRKVSVVRRAWNHALRALAGFQQLLCRHGGAAVSAAYCWPDRQRWSLQSGQLPVGDTCATGEQSAYQRAYRGQYSSGTRPQAWGNTGSNSVPHEDGHGPAVYGEKAQKELRTYSDPEKLGWVSNMYARFAKTCGGKREPKQPGGRFEGYMAGVEWGAQLICGFLLGVRRAGTVEAVETPDTPFVNFLTDGDHTFFACGVLTHNCGVGGAVAGRGADLLLVDDPHNEQDIINGNYDVFEKAYQWFTFGARTRLMSGGRIAVVHTRWHQDDLIGQLVRDGANNEKADQYEVFEFPAILDTESGPKALWPEKFDLDALERTKASMPVFQWNAQYMQHPTAEEAAIIKREWWRPWKADTPPKCDYVIMTLDAAAEKHNRADFTALLTFGVFTDDHVTNGEPHLILLNAINVRVEFPELKDLALREYRDWEPDAFIVEKKSAGTQLYQELRRIGVPVQECSPSRATGDKVARLNAVADILRSGMVWYPENRRWAEEVIEQVVTFPLGSHDDMVDCVSMALSRFRQGGFIELPSDYRDPEPLFKQHHAAYYSV